MVKEYSHCRLCGGALHEILNFGETALANSYLKTTDLGESEFKAPLLVCKCEICGSFQLKHTVSPEKLFSNYLYASSDSKGLKVHFENYAATIFREQSLQEGDLVVDIGSNDGVLLEPFQKLGCRILGIEPASNLAATANAKGLRTISTFFNTEVARSLVTESGHADLITCNNCFAHIDNLQGILDGIKVLLKPNGLFLFENAYWLDSVRGKYFDQVYHEHIFYHSIKPLRSFLNKNGFIIEKVDRNEIQGGTIRVFCRLMSETVTQQPLTLEVEEINSGLYEVEFYTAFQRDLNELKTELGKIIKRETNQGKTFACYGAPAKATLLCKFFELSKETIKFIVDDSPLKQGLFMPETHIPIVSKQEILKQSPDYIIIAAWNFANAIISNNGQFKGKWIVPMPTIKIYDNSGN